MIRLRPLTEAECYARCYGGWEATVRVVRLEPRRPRFPTTVSGEELRRRFEERIDGREPYDRARHEAAAPEAA
jgi:hypothetical protein